MPNVSIEEVEEICRRELPLAVQMGMTIEDLGKGEVTVRLPFLPDYVRPGGTIAGPLMMALADFAMWVAVMSRIGPQEMAVTANLSCNFLRRPKPADVWAKARVIKLGKRLAYGEVSLFSDGELDEEPIAHATLTYSVPPVAVSEGG